MILNILKIYLSGNLRHKGMKSVLRCIYFPLKNISHIYLISCPIVKIKFPYKYFYQLVKSWYVIVSIIEKPYSSSLGFFRHSMALGIDEIGEVMSSLPKFGFILGEYLMTWHRLAK